MMSRLGDSLDEEHPRRTHNLGVVVRLLGYTRPYGALMALSTLGMLLYSLTSVVAPWTVRSAIDGVVASNLSDLRMAVIFLTLNALANYGSSYLHLAALARVSQRVLFDLRTQLFSHLQHLPLPFFDRNEAGRIMSRVQNDVQQLQEFLSVLILGLGDLLTLMGIVVAMVFMNWKLALITLSVLPLLFLIMALWQRRAWRTFMRVRRSIALVNAGLQENISGVRVIQSLNREEANIQRFDRLNYQHLDANLQAGRLASALLPSVDVLTATATGFVIVFGGMMVLMEELAVGILVAFALYIQRFFEPVRNLTMQYTQLQRAMTSGVHIFELLDTRKEVERPEAKELPPVKGEIRFEGVAFQYTPGVEVLRNVNLTIRPGEKVAIVGPTGAGKTTLAFLLTRLYDVTEGRITIDGHDIRDVRRSSLARQIGLVLQEPFLFSGSVKENIRYCRTGVTDEQVVEAAKVAGAHPFIEGLEQGYDTQLEERGINLSPGQRQLVALARAIAGDPRIVILDEAVSSVDSYTESLIQRGLRRLLEGRTALIISHRLSTIRHADRVIVLDQGQIVEEGTHRELLERGGLYARISAVSQRD